jgi:hypothetical protein
MSNKESVTYGTEELVPINDRTITVEKLGLLSYAKMSGILRGLIASVIDAVREQAEWVSASAAPEARGILVADLITKLIETNVIQVINFIDLCVPDVGREYLEQKVGLYDMVLLVEAIMKVNNINRAFEQGKKLISNYLGRTTA